MLTRRFAVLCLMLASAAASSAHARPFNDTQGEQRIETLFELIEQRLTLMKDVAADKYRRELAIEDLERENTVLDSAADAALSRGLTPASSRFFFALQIEAAKEVQRYWFEEWASGRPPPQTSLDLVTQLRPRLTTLGDAIVEAIAASHPISDRSLATQFVRSVSVEGLSDAAKFALFRALFEIERFASSLDQVLQTGHLRVGTTGDYAPFSLTRDGTTDGIDIALAKDLAQSLGVTLQLVPTTWPALMDDLAAGQFDIAMGGISRTLERQQQGFFSRAYHLGGKTPIARCDKADNFASLSAIDQADVRVIVNPGGTNQAYVRKMLQSAEVIEYPDNTLIFTELVQDRADVMITDAIEVALQTRLNPSLCATMAGETLTYQEKGYLMPRDAIWLEYVNTWLAQRQADGTVEKIFNQHLSRQGP